MTRTLAALKTEHDLTEARKREIADLKKVLLDKKEQLIQQSNKSLKHALNEGLTSPTGGDLVDQTMPVDLAVMNQLEETARKLLRNIDEALFLIKKGTGYGICKECGEEISIARLRAVPSSIFCRDCKEQHDQGNTINVSGSLRRVDNTVPMERRSML